MNSRLANPSDWKAYKEIRLEALKNVPEAFGQSYEGAANQSDSHWQDMLSQENRFFAFTEEGQDIVSMAGAKQIAEDTWFVIAVYTRPAFRGKGLARRTVEAVLEELKKRKVAKAELWVNPSQEAAIALYKSLGFSITRTEPNQQMGDGLLYDEYVMEKVLN